MPARRMQGGNRAAAPGCDGNAPATHRTGRPRARPRWGYPLDSSRRAACLPFAARRVHSAGATTGAAPWMSALLREIQQRREPDCAPARGEAPPRAGCRSPRLEPLPSASESASREAEGSVEMRVTRGAVDEVIAIDARRWLAPTDDALRRPPLPPSGVALRRPRLRSAWRTVCRAGGTSETGQASFTAASETSWGVAVGATTSV